jgi:hypothetical protein
MRLVRKVAIIGALLVPMATNQASAQSWKWDWNINAGYSFFNEMLSAENSGLAGASENDVKFKNGGLLGSQLTFWPSSRFGIRLNGTYADRPVVAENYTLTSPAGSGLSHVNLWSGSGDLLFRFARPREEYAGMEVLPYLALGIGAKWHNPSGDAYTCNDTEEGENFACAPFTVTNGTATGNTLALAEANSLMGLVGLGADWRIARNFAIRTEIGDRIWDAKLHATTGNPATGANYTLQQGDTDFGDDVHELYVQAGLTFLFGVARPAVVAVVAPPAPVEPAPAPAPVVSRESLSICVVDPTAPGGIRMQSAFLVGGRDTVVVVGTEDRPFSTSVGTVAVASNADWYVRGQPLVINVGTTNTIEYATYGSARMIEASDLAYVGTVNGMPVYADRDDVVEFNDELVELNRTRAGTDFGVILNDNRELRTEFNNVKVLYVPMNASGCVFQAVQLQEQVRKGK